jgi:hypothetical protein
MNCHASPRWRGLDFYPTVSNNSALRLRVSERHGIRSRVSLRISACVSVSPALVRLSCARNRGPSHVQLCGIRTTCARSRSTDRRGSLRLGGCLPLARASVAYVDANSRPASGRPAGVFGFFAVHLCGVGIGRVLLDPSRLRRAVGPAGGEHARVGARVSSRAYTPAISFRRAGAGLTDREVALVSVPPFARASSHVLGEPRRVCHCHNGRAIQCSTRSTRKRLCVQ